MSPIQKAVDVVGGQSRLAELLGVSASFVSQWISGARPVPATRCMAIEKATGGEVSRADLRPDVFGEAVA